MYSMIANSQNRYAIDPDCVIQAIDLAQFWLNISEQLLAELCISPVLQVYACL